MSFSPTEVTEPSPFVVRAELALQALKQRVVTHLDRESQLRRACVELQDTWLSRVESLRQQISEVEARLAPWIPRDEAPRLAVVSRVEELN